jgi:hypothetical protein
MSTRIDRLEIANAMFNLGAKEFDIEPALQLIEPVFQQMDSGFNLSPGAPLSCEAIQEAISRAYGGEPQVLAMPYRYKLRIKRNYTQPLMAAWRGTTFGEVIAPCLERVTTPVTLRHLSFGLEQAVATGVRQSLMDAFNNQLPQPEEAQACMAIALQNLTDLLTVYFNLAIAGDTKVLRDRIKPAILLLPTMLPICSVKDQPEQWCVLVG